MNDPQNVPSFPVTWVARTRKTRILVVARLWFEARQEAMCTLGVGPDQLKVTRLK